MHLLFAAPSSSLTPRTRIIVCMSQVQHNTHAPESALSASCIVLAPTVRVGEQQEAVELLDAQFFDDESAVIVFRRQEQGALLSLASPPTIAPAEAYKVLSFEFPLCVGGWGD